MTTKTLSKKDKIDYILKSYPKAEITIASCFDNCDVIAVTDREDGNIVYFADKKDCEKDEKSGDVRCILKTFNKDLKAFDFLCLFKVKNEKYIKKVCRWIIFF